VKLGELKELFESESEKEFLKKTYSDDLKIIRLTLFVSVVFYGIFSIADKWQAPEMASFFLLVRFCFVIPLFIATISLTYWDNFHKVHQMAYLVNFIAAGVGVVIMILSVPDNYLYYGSLFFVLYCGYSLIRLRFAYASIGGWLIFAFFTVGLMFNYRNITIETYYFIGIFLGLNLLGMISSYHFECIIRTNYLQKRNIEHYNKNLEDQVREKVEEISLSHVGTIYALARLVESRDEGTGKHIERTGQYCRILAENLPRHFYESEWTTAEKFVDIIKVASALHDIGKVAVPDYILNKPGKLTKAEFEIMKKHSDIGCETLLAVLSEYPDNDFVRMGIEITRHHHEWYNGKGYPDGLFGKEIPLSARIMAVADAYDALVSKRPYKMAYTHEKAYAMIVNESGEKFDPDIVKVFRENEWIFKSIVGKYQSESGIA